MGNGRWAKALRLLLHIIAILAVAFYMIPKVC